MIEVKNLSKVFDDITAVNQVNLVVQEGIVFGLLGTNGAGKSTLFRLLTTLIAPDSGSASLNGLDIVKD